MTDPQIPPPVSPDEPAGEDASRFQQALCWALLLAAVAAVLYAEYHWMHHRLRLGLPWMLGGILLAGIAGSFHPLRRSLVPPAGRTRLRTAEKWFLAALVAGGGLVRFLSLDRFPPGGFFDEVQNLLVADGILAGDRPVFVGGATQLPALVFYLLAAAVKVAGRSVETVRGLSALFGTLTLPAFYFLARRAFAWPAAAAAALLLAGSRWHITFSRVGFVTIMKMITATPTPSRAPMIVPRVARRRNSGDSGPSASRTAICRRSVSARGAVRDPPSHTTWMRVPQPSTSWGSTLSWALP